MTKQATPRFPFSTYIHGYCNITFVIIKNIRNRIAILPVLSSAKQEPCTKARRKPTL
jgi:hypothetical protein